MVDGGDHIVPAEWKTVSNIIQRVCNTNIFFYISVLYIFSFDYLALIKI